MTAAPQDLPDVPRTMRAMVLRAPGEPLLEERRPVPRPGPTELLLKVLACGICRTDLHVVDGDLPEPALPLIPGHQIVAQVVACGAQAVDFAPGQRVGVPWLGGSCGHCRFCVSGRENLCAEARYTGYQRDGGFAEYCLADAGYCFALPSAYADLQAAPLLCAGLIGYRAWRPVREARRLGLYGFGASAHILTQLARDAGQDVYAFTRPGDVQAQDFARRLGACWAGASGDDPGVRLDAAILFAPVGELVPLALAQSEPGATIVCAGIHMSDIPGFPYRLLWGERQIVSVANLTRRDGEEFLPLAAAIPVRTEVHVYPLGAANAALADLRAGRFTGAAVLDLSA
jgi:propanol-preferring alcohol dehydrogenase